MAWKPLQLSASAGAHLPPLLIATNFTTDSCTIYLTDLTSIWSESLDRRAIIRRSREENTSIDPSDTDQFQIFREKIKRGLDGGKGTALALTIQADPSRPPLVLNVTVDLPGGLAPLQWPIRLAAAPQSLLTSQLITPLLRAQHERMQEMASLADILKEKDHVIQKLLDKLESQGMELGQVFPQAAGKVGRKLDRKKAAERVKGLAPFDVGVWKEGLGHEESRDTTELVGDVFGSSLKVLTLEVGEQISEDTEEWWENIKGITVNLNTGKISTKGPFKASSKTPPPPKPVLRKETSSNDDDAFQVQATPPRSLHATKSSPPKAASSESTDDEDLDGPSQRSKIPDSFPKSPSPPPKVPSPKPAKKFGKIGGKKTAPRPSPPPIQDVESTDDEDPIPQSKLTKRASPQVPIPDEATEADDESTSPPPPPKRAFKARSPTSSPEPKPQKKLGKIGGKKELPPPPPPAESETDDEPEPEPTPPPKASPPPAAKPKKAKLGQIGGKKKAAETTPVPEESIATSPALKAGVKRKLGAIGHKTSPSKSVKQENASQMAIEEIASRGRASTKEKTPPPRETSEERANRKREELRRELEEKAKAPAKKKRKF
ncbi:hypothetical protein EG329_006070 [Mollisiaceae sp. DMI_Dod_QoI]|nr:hypothetical protein EG329_006070 [Helotiales sp. DMI_Dod_QoI]